MSAYAIQKRRKRARPGRREKENEIRRKRLKEARKNETAEEKQARLGKRRELRAATAARRAARKWDVLKSTSNNGDNNPSQREYTY